MNTKKSRVFANAIMTATVLALSLASALAIDIGEADATVPEPTCTFSANGPWSSTAEPTSSSITCTGVTGDSINATIPVPGGSVQFWVGSADAVYGSDTAVLPSSFTVNQSDTPPADDTDPSAPVFYGATYGSADGCGSGPVCITASNPDGDVTTYTSGYTFTGTDFGNNTYDPTSNLTALGTSTTSAAGPVIITTVISLLILALVLYACRRFIHLLFGGEL